MHTIKYSHVEPKSYSLQCFEVLAYHSIFWYNTYAILVQHAHFVQTINKYNRSIYFAVHPMKYVESDVMTWIQWQTFHDQAIICGLFHIQQFTSAQDLAYTIDREIFALKIIRIKNFRVNKFSRFRSIHEIF